MARHSCIPTPSLPFPFGRSATSARHAAAAEAKRHSAGAPDAHVLQFCSLSLGSRSNSNQFTLLNHAGIYLVFDLVNETINVTKMVLMSCQSFFVQKVCNKLLTVSGVIEPSFNGFFIFAFCAACALSRFLILENLNRICVVKMRQPFSSRV